MILNSASQVSKASLVGLWLILVVIMRDLTSKVSMAFLHIEV